MRAVAIGIGATLLMDLWNLFLMRTFGIPSLNYCLLGRWQPSLGLGVASSRAPNPARARLKSLVTHTVFGIGL